MDAINDGGPAFPEAGLSGLPNGEFIHGRSGMSQRALFAAILMHAELTTCGVPEACEELVKAAEARSRDVEDQMAANAVQCADALLRALAEPKEAPPPPPRTKSLEEEFFPRFEATLRAIAGGHMPLTQTVQNLVAEYDDGQIPF